MPFVTQPQPNGIAVCEDLGTEGPDLNPHNNPARQARLYTHFIGEETEVVRGKVTCLRAHS